jgi:Family of unknown function (DUF5670)
MLAAIGAVLLVLWLLGFLAFHVTTGAIHILLVLAIIFVGNAFLPRSKCHGLSSLRLLEGGQACRP